MKTTEIYPSRYHVAEGRRVLVTDTEVRESLIESPALLALWKQGVKCCRYSPMVIRKLLDKLELSKEVSSAERKYGGEQSLHSDSALYSGRFPSRTFGKLHTHMQSPLTDLSDPARDATVPELTLRESSESAYKLVSRTAKLISNQSAIVSILMSERGDVCIVYLPYACKKLQLFFPRRHLRCLCAN